MDSFHTLNERLIGAMVMPTAGKDFTPDVAGAIIQGYHCLRLLGSMPDTQHYTMTLPHLCAALIGLVCVHHTAAARGTTHVILQMAAEGELEDLIIPNVVANWNRLRCYFYHVSDADLHQIAAQYMRLLQTQMRGLYE